MTKKAYDSSHAALRQGRITGSTVKVLVDGGYKAKNTLLQKINEPARVYGKASPRMPAQLRWGHQHEPWLRGVFWEEHGEYELHKAGDAVFVIPNDGGYGGTERDLPPEVISHTGTSPDGILLDAESMAQVSGYEGKCPYSRDALIAAIDGAEWVKRWRPQCDLNMLVTNSDYWWLVIGDPREPPTSRLRYTEILIQRDRKREEFMIEAICEFVHRLNKGIPYRKRTTRETEAAIKAIRPTRRNQ